MWQSRSIIPILGWDGILPLLVAIAPLVVRLAFPGGHIAKVVIVVTLPICFALVRAIIGTEQLAQVCDDSISPLRQIIFGAAIILLLLFEIAITMLHFADDEPISAWLAPPLLFIAYVVMIFVALRPAQPSVDSQRAALRT